MHDRSERAMLKTTNYFEYKSLASRLIYSLVILELSTFRDGHLC
jgi:hypothetical protein